MRPGDVGWPDAPAWDALGRSVGGRLVPLRDPFESCRVAPDGEACRTLGATLRNSFAIGDDPALTQSTGWLDAWVTRPSAFAVEAESAADIVAAVQFAREHDLRLVVRGGGHSYQGTSCAPDSLLVTTRAMRAVTLLDAFLPAGAPAGKVPEPAATIEAGALWLHAYDAVSVRGGRYVQGGGCLTVGVAGLVQSGGFGSFSKRFGTAAGNLLEAEIVTADGVLRTVNAHRDPDLFWALKGGGGGSFGIVSRLTLRTHPLPDTFGAVTARIRAHSDEAFRALIRSLLEHYRDRLFDAHWGEQIKIRPRNVVEIAMLFQRLDEGEARRLWTPFFEQLAGLPGDCTVEEGPAFVALPARRLWDAAFLRAAPGGLVTADDRPGAPSGNIVWAGDAHQAGQFIHGFRSAWLPASLLAPDAITRLRDALFEASRHWPIELHLNKGLAGAPAQALSDAAATAMNPAVLDAFALAICAAGGAPPHGEAATREAEQQAGRRRAAAIGRAFGVLQALRGEPASYLSESDFFEPDWQRAFWGRHHARLAAVKRRYDPQGLFVVHHGIGSERWSADGFTRLG